MKNTYKFKINIWISFICLLLFSFLNKIAAQTAVTAEAGYTNAYRYNYTGADQTFTVPAGVYFIKVKTWGAGGGSEGCCNDGGSPLNSGAGGFTTATIPVTPGQVLKLVVGQGGKKGNYTQPFSAYGFGGADENDGSGGGLSGVFLTSVNQGNALVIAGGGGGTANYNSASTSIKSNSGGNGNAPSSGGMAGMNGMDDNAYGGSYDNSQVGSGGGGYHGGNLHERQRIMPANGTSYIGQLGYMSGWTLTYNRPLGFGGNGGSGYVINTAYCSSLLYTPEFNPTAPNTSDVHYVSGIANGVTYIEGTDQSGGNGLIVLEYNSASGSFSYSPSSSCDTMTPTTSSLPTGTGITYTYSSTAGLSIDSSTGVINAATSTPGTYTVTATEMASGCPVASFTTTVTVLAINTVTAASSSPSVCGNTAITSITHTTTGATGIGTATGLPAGVTATWASNIITISGTPTATGTFNYTIPLTGGCGTVNATGTITVTDCSTPCDPIIWYHDVDGKLYKANVNTGISTVMCSNFHTPDGYLFLDIGFAPDGTLYGVGPLSTGFGSGLYRINLATCTSTLITPSSGAFPNQCNSLSFLPDGTALIGTSSNGNIRRVTISGNTCSIAIWASLFIGNSAGDYLLFGNKLYAALYNSSGDNVIAEISINSDYSFNSVLNTYSLAASVSGQIYGMAGYDGKIFAGFANGTLRELTISGSNINYSANLLSSSPASIWGATSIPEPLGEGKPTITPNGTISVCNPISTNLSSSFSSNNQWYKDGSIIPGATAQTYTVTQVGSYTVAYTSISGCKTYISDPVVISAGTCSCYKPAVTTGTTLDTKHGITALGRAGSDTTDNWPMVRKGAWTALEAKTKGFVVNRLTAAEIAAIPIANCIEGMMVYDTTNKCLKIYTTTDGINYSWQCFGKQSCPD